MTQKNQTLYMENKMNSICQSIDRAIYPTDMTMEEAKEFLEGLQMEIESRLEGLKESISQENETAEKAMMILSRGGDEI